MKYVSIDIETCGLDWNEHSVIEFGAVVEDTQNELPLDQLPVFSKILSHKNYIGTPYALSLNKAIFDELAKKERTPDIIPADELGMAFRNWLFQQGFKEGYPIIINAAGKNFGTFDMRFLENIPNFKNHVWFNRRILDPAILYFNTNTDKELPNLSVCKQRAGIEDTTIAHRTVADALDVIRVLRTKL